MGYLWAEHQFLFECILGIFEIFSKLVIFRKFAFQTFFVSHFYINTNTIKILLKSFASCGYLCHKTMYLLFIRAIADKMCFIWNQLIRKVDFKSLVLEHLYTKCTFCTIYILKNESMYKYYKHTAAISLYFFHVLKIK